MFLIELISNDAYFLSKYVFENSYEYIFIFVIVANTVLLFYINLTIFPMKARKMFKLKLVSIKRTDIYY